MGSRTQAAIETLKYLNTQRFPTAAAFQIAHIDHGTLANYLNKSGLILCSESRKGVTRRLCLIDIYQIVLLSELVRLNRSPTVTAYILNNALFTSAMHEMLDWDNAGEMVKADDGLSFQQQVPLKGDPGAIKGRFCQDIFATPPAYWHRDRDRPIFAVHSTVSEGIIWTTERPDLDDSYNPSAIICNVTALLNRVDLRLFEKTDRGQVQQAKYREEQAKVQTRFEESIAHAKGLSATDQTAAGEQERTDDR